MQNKRSNRGFTSLLITVMLIFILYSLFPKDTEKSDKTTYQEIKSHFAHGRVEEFRLNLESGELKYRLTMDADDKMREYKVPDPYLFYGEIRTYVEEYNAENPGSAIKYDVTASTSFWTYIIAYLPTLLLIGGVVFMYVMMSRQGGQIGNVGKARTKKGYESDKTATFDDVAGAEEEKEELQEIVEYLKNPNKFNTLGAKIPKGVLLIGPPGTGKTLLARAVAGEAGVPFYSISGSDFVELYVGIGAARVRDLFSEAKKSRPSIIFIDEIDAVGRQRGAGLGGGHDEREQTLNQLLVELDGFVGNEGVIVMAATNRSDVLDSALLRPGRFDRQVYVGYPDIKGREEILKVHSRNKPLGPDVDLKTIAKTTAGFTGADLENLLNEAALLAARRNKKAITQKEIEESSIKVVAGPEKKSRVVTPKKRRVVAYHEAGHAIAMHIATPDQPVHQISIVPRGMMGGFTMALPEDDDNLISKTDMMNDIVTLLGGRVAEKLVINDITTGASSDLERATTIARSMVTKYGFSDSIGSVVYNTHDEVFLGRDFTQSRNYSEKVASDIDGEVKALIDKAMTQCTDIMTKNLDKLHDVANALLAQDKLDSEEFASVMAGTFKIPEADEPSADSKEEK